MDKGFQEARRLHGTVFFVDSADPSFSTMSTWMVMLVNRISDQIIRLRYW